MNDDRRDYIQTEAVSAAGTSAMAQRGIESAPSVANYRPIYFSHPPNINVLCQSFLPHYDGHHPSIDEDALKEIYDMIEGEKDLISRYWDDNKHQPGVQKLVADHFRYPPQAVELVLNLYCDCIDAQRYRDPSARSLPHHLGDVEDETPSASNRSKTRST